MEQQSLPLPFKQLYPGTTFGNLSDMPYPQLSQMQNSMEQPIPGFYDQNIQEFGMPSESSVDSGFDEVNPFDKDPQHHARHDVRLNQNCLMDHQSTISGDFDAFGFAPSYMQRDPTDFSTYPTSGLATSFQPSIADTDAYMRYQTSPGLEDASEDGQSASIGSNSPREAVFGLDASPRHQNQSSWTSRPDASKPQTTDGSSVETKYNSEERTVRKAAPTRGRPRKRIPHTAVERRYRENLNAHLEKLRGAVPNLIAAQRRKSTDGANPLKPSKCEVLMGAVDYIKRLEMENERLKRKLNG